MSRVPSQTQTRYIPRERDEQRLLKRRWALNEYVPCRDSIEEQDQNFNKIIDAIIARVNCLEQLELPLEEYDEEEVA